jgi:hypothetical protein
VIAIVARVMQHPSLLSSFSAPPDMMLAFLSTTTKNRITPTNSNVTRNDMVIINLSLLQ